MKAIQVTRFGGPEVLELRDLDEPVPEADEVLIDVEIVEIIHLDTQLRSGWGADYFPMRPPWVPGTGVAGTLRGSDERVVARTGDQGAYAERVAVNRRDVFAIPAALNPAVATAALHDGVQALSQLTNADPGPASRVLVTGAAGALGHWFVPLAKLAGAEVIGAAGGARKVAAVAGLGADRIVDYLQPGWEHGLGMMHIVMDGVGGALGRAAAAMLRPGGVLCAYGAASGGFGVPPRDDITVHGIDTGLSGEGRIARTNEALRLLSNGTVRPTIGQRVPFADAVEAHAAIDRREVIGKSVLVV